MSPRPPISAIATIGCVLGGFALGQAPALAQAVPATEAEVARAAAQADGTGTSALQDTPADVILEAGEDGALLTAQVGFRTRNERNNLQMGLKFKAPVDTSTKEASFVNLDGLTAGTTGALGLTFERTGKPLRWFGLGQGVAANGAPGPFEAICIDANKLAQKRLAAEAAELPKDGSCSLASLKNDAFWSNVVEQRLDASRWELCQEINKKRATGWLAPPRVEPDPGAGYTLRCNAETLASLRTAALDGAVKKDAALLLAVPGFETASEEERKAEQLWRRCEVFNQERETLAFFRSGEPAPNVPKVEECRTELLAAAILKQELDKKEKEVETKVCQEARVVPPEKLFTTETGATNNCLMSSLLPWAAASERPGYWYRRILRAIPLAFYYVTAEAVVADQKFKFLDPQAEFAERSSDGHSRSLNLTFSVYQAGWLGSVGYARLTTLTASPSSQVCLPAGGGALLCRQAALAGPAETETEVIRAEIKGWLRPGLGATLRTNYDLDHGEWEHHLLLHFLRDPKKGLTGGVDLQYGTALADPKEEHLTARVFVGTKFELPFMP